MKQKVKEQHNMRSHGCYLKKTPFFWKPCIIIFVFSLWLLGLSAVFTDLTRGMEQTFNQNNIGDLMVISETGFTQDDINRIREINTVKQIENGDDIKITTDDHRTLKTTAVSKNKALNITLKCHDQGIAFYEPAYEEQVQATKKRIQAIKLDTKISDSIDFTSTLENEETKENKEISTEIITAYTQEISKLQWTIKSRNDFIEGYTEHLQQLKTAQTGLNILFYSGIAILTILLIVSIRKECLKGIRNITSAEELGFQGSKSIKIALRSIFCADIAGLLAGSLFGSVVIPLLCKYMVSRTAILQWSLHGPWLTFWILVIIVFIVSLMTAWMTIKIELKRLNSPFMRHTFLERKANIHSSSEIVENPNKRLIKILLWPTIKKYKRLFCAMIAISCFGIALMVGMTGATKGLKEEFDTYLSDYDYCDATITTSPLNALLANDIRAIDGVRGANARLVYDFNAKLKSDRSVQVRGFSCNETDFQQFYVWEDIPNPDDSQYVYMDYDFAQNNEIHVGDQIKIQVDDEWYDVIISKIVSSPETMRVSRDKLSSLDSTDFGCVFVPDTLLSQTEIALMVNQFLITYDEGINQDEVIERVKTAIGEEHILSVSKYEDSVVKQLIDINVEPTEIASVFVPTVFFICMIVILTLFLGQILRLSRKDIGVLRANGFEIGCIRRLYCVMVLVITLIACFIGVVFGVVIMILMLNIFGSSIGIPIKIYTIDYGKSIIAVVITIISGQIAAFFSTNALAKILPSEAMSREIVSGGRIPNAIGKFLSRLKPVGKYAVTSFLRNFKRLVFSVICSVLAFMMMYLAIGFYASKELILREINDVRIQYDAMIVTDDHPDIKAYGAIEGVSSLESAKAVSANISANGKTQNRMIYGIDPNAKLICITQKDGSVLTVEDDGIVLEQKTAEQLDVSVGDFVKINDVSLKVMGISYQGQEYTEYVTLDTIDQLGSSQNLILCKCSDEEQLLNGAMKIDGYNYTSFKRISEKTIKKLVSGLDTAAIIILLIAIMMGIFTLYNTNQTNIYQQRRELAVLRSIGFQVRDISHIWMVQTLVQYLLSVLIGLPLGMFTLNRFLLMMETDLRTYLSPGKFMVSIFTSLMALAYVFFSHYVAMHSVKKWNLVELTKDKE